MKPAARSPFLPTKGVASKLVTSAGWHKSVQMWAKSMVRETLSCRPPACLARTAIGPWPPETGARSTHPELRLCLRIEMRCSRGSVNPGGKGIEMFSSSMLLERLMTPDSAHIQQLLQIQCKLAVTEINGHASGKQKCQQPAAIAICKPSDRTDAIFICPVCTPAEHKQEISGLQLCIEPSMISATRAEVLSQRLPEPQLFATSQM